jgi:hypothetical protein
MSRPGIILSALALALIPFSAAAAPNAGDDQTATTDTLSTADLADVLGLHWWAVRIPDGMPPSSSIGVEWVSADGKGLTKMTGQSATISNTLIAGGAIVKIFCRDQPGGPEVVISAPGGVSRFTFPGISLRADSQGGPADGSFANNGDLLLKLIKRSPDGTISVIVGNDLKPGDIALRVNIKPGPRTAAAK